MRFAPIFGALLPLLAVPAAAEETDADRRIRLLAARTVLTAQVVSRIEDRTERTELAGAVLKEIGDLKVRPDSPAAARVFLASARKLLDLFSGDQLIAERQRALRVCTEMVGGAGPEEQLLWRVRAFGLEVDLARDEYDPPSARRWTELLGEISDPAAGSAEHRAELQKAAAVILKQDWWQKPLAARLDAAPSAEALQAYREDVGVRAALLAGLVRIVAVGELEFKLFLSKLQAAPAAAGDRPAARALALWETYEMLAALARETGDAWSELGPEIQRKLTLSAGLIPLELKVVGAPARWPLGLPEDVAVSFDADAPPGFEVVAWAAPEAPFVLAGLDRLGWDRYYVGAGTVWAVRLAGRSEPLAVARWEGGAARAVLPLPGKLPEGYVLFLGAHRSGPRICSHRGWSRTRFVEVLESVRPGSPHEDRIKKLHRYAMNREFWEKAEVDAFEDPATRLRPDDRLTWIVDGSALPDLRLPEPAFLQGLPRWVLDLLGWDGDLTVLTKPMRKSAKGYSLHDVIDVRSR